MRLRGIERISDVFSFRNQQIIGGFHMSDEVASAAAVAAEPVVLGGPSMA
ncbi:MAG: hypothetical protein JRD04_01835 [Deltaproteobacteria bacterium]|nr:hypothetical protein [Deltaproteobacteria bacterium]